MFTKKPDQLALPPPTFAQEVEKLNDRLKKSLSELGDGVRQVYEVRIVDTGEDGRKRQLAEAEAKAVLARHEGALVTLKAQHEAELEKLRREHDAALAEKERLLTEIRARTGTEIGYLRDEIANLRQTNATLAARPTTVEVKAEPTVGVVYQPPGGQPKFYQEQRSERTGGHAQPHQKGQQNPQRKED